MAFAEALSDDGSLTGRGAPVLRGVPAKITGAHTIPMAKIVDPRILDMAYTPIRAPRLAASALSFCYLARIPV